MLERSTALIHWLVASVNENIISGNVRDANIRTEVVQRRVRQRHAVVRRRVVHRDGLMPAEERGQASRGGYVAIFTNGLVEAVRVCDDVRRLERQLTRDLRLDDHRPTWNTLSNRTLPLRVRDFDSREGFFRADPCRCEYSQVGCS